MPIIADYSGTTADSSGATAQANGTFYATVSFLLNQTGCIQNINNGQSVRET